MKTKAADLNYTRHSATVNSEGFVTFPSRHPFHRYKHQPRRGYRVTGTADIVACAGRWCVLFILPTCSQAMQWHIPRLAALIAAIVEIVFERGHKQTGVILFINTIYGEALEITCETPGSARVNLTSHLAGATAAAAAAETKWNQSKQYYGTGGCNQEPGAERYFRLPFQV